jgi:hypothetical protein
MDKQRILSTIQDPGFWRGMTYVATALGIYLSPDQQNAIITMGLALSGCIHAFVASRPKS